MDKNNPKHVDWLSRRITATVSGNGGLTMGNAEVAAPSFTPRNHPALYVSLWEPDTKPLNTKQFTEIRPQNPQVFYPGLAASSIPCFSISLSLFLGGKSRQKYAGFCCLKEVPLCIKRKKAPWCILYETEVTFHSSQML